MMNKTLQTGPFIVYESDSYLYVDVFKDGIPLIELRESGGRLLLTVHSAEPILKEFDVKLGQAKRKEVYDWIMKELNDETIKTLEVLE